MIYQRDAVSKVQLYVASGNFAEARRWMKRVHPSWLPELLTDPSDIVQKMADRRLRREVAIQKL